jgi:hypothetical protein
MSGTRVNLIVSGDFHKVGKMLVAVNIDCNGEIQISHAAALRIRRHIDCGRSKNHRNRCDCFRVARFYVTRENDPIGRLYLAEELRDAVFEKLGIEKYQPGGCDTEDNYLVS